MFQNGDKIQVRHRVLEVVSGQVRYADEGVTGVIRGRYEADTCGCDNSTYFIVEADQPIDGWPCILVNECDLVKLA